MDNLETIELMSPAGMVVVDKKDVEDYLKRDGWSLIPQPIENEISEIPAEPEIFEEPDYPQEYIEPTEDEPIADEPEEEADNQEED